METYCRMQAPQATYSGSAAKEQLNDLLSGLKRWHFWGSLAFTDIKKRYKRSILGPWWITIGFATLLLSISLVFGRFMGQDMQSFMPYLASGLLVWTFVAATLGDSIHVFPEASHYIKQARLPFSIFILRLLTRNLIIFAHNILVVLAIFAYYKHPITPALLMLVPGMFLLILNLHWISFTVATLGTRFQDLGQMILNAIQFLFFLTPVMWRPLPIHANSWIIKLNPFSYYLDLVRAPLLGNMPALKSWIVSGLLCIAGQLLLLLVVSRYRNRIAFWI